MAQTVSHLIVLFVFSIKSHFAICFAGDTSLDELGDLEESTGRLLFIFYNSSTTVSTAYAIFIVLAISCVLAAIAGAVYLGLLGGLGSSNYSSKFKSCCMHVRELEMSVKESARGNKEMKLFSDCKK